MASDEDIQETVERLSCKDPAWRCTQCGALLGFYDRETRTKVRLKDGARYTYIDDPKRLATTCTKCGQLNEVENHESAPVDAPCPMCGHTVGRCVQAQRDKEPDSSGATEDGRPDLALDLSA